jgi:xanthine dehydrogenase accessory factor
MAEVVVMQEVAEAVRVEVGRGRPVVIGRVTDVKGFSTLPVDELVAICGDGSQHGDLLGRPGAERLGAAANEMFRSGSDTLRLVGIEIHGKEVEEVGLACGGRAEILLQPAQAIPAELWGLLASRAPVALMTRIEGPHAGTPAMVIDRDGHSWGELPGPPATARLRDDALALLLGGRSSQRRVEQEDGVVLIEAWVPAPRLVVVGTGEVVSAIAAQADLLGWETRATDGVDQIGELLDWAGTTAALIVLSHDPHIDAPSLAAGLARGAAYIGAMGSRSTQARRADRLLADGVSPEELGRIHRPIGLDLGGRRAAEVALAIVAEILAGHCGRDGRPLKDTTGPIHDRRGALTSSG